MKQFFEFSEGISHFYDDDEIINFLSKNEHFYSIYNELDAVEGLSAVYPLVFPRKPLEFNYDLLLIIKHKVKSEIGQWDLYIVDNFVQDNINLSSLLNTIEQSTGSETLPLLQIITKSLKEYRIHFKADGKTYLEIDAENKIVAYGFQE